MHDANNCEINIVDHGEFLQPTIWCYKFWFCVVVLFLCLDRDSRFLYCIGHTLYSCSFTTGLVLI